MSDELLKINLRHDVCGPAERTQRHFFGPIFKNHAYVKKNKIQQLDAHRQKVPAHQHRHDITAKTQHKFPLCGYDALQEKLLENEANKAVDEHTVSEMLTQSTASAWWAPWFSLLAQDLGSGSVS